MGFESVVQLICTVAVAVATVVLVIVTWKYVCITGETLRELRASREPYVFLKFESPGPHFDLVVGNSGQSAALNVIFELQEDIVWRLASSGGNITIGGGRLKKMPIFDSGLSHIAPGENLRYSCRGSPNHGNLGPGNFCVSIGITYEDEAGKTFARRVNIDMRAFDGVLFSSFEGGRRDSVAEELRKIGRLLRKHLPGGEYRSPGAAESETGQNPTGGRPQ